MYVKMENTMGYKLKTYINLFLLISILLVLLTDCGKSSTEAGWPRWRGPNGDGISTETDWDPKALESAPKILWKFNLGLAHSNVAIRDNRLYAVGSIGVVCLNAETGEQIWIFEDGSFLESRSTPTLDGGNLYVVSRGAMLYCLRAKTGKNKKGETMIVVVQPPIPTGVYTVRAVSMDSDKTAECKLVFKNPSIIDKLKDWMGKQMGKISYKK